MALFITAMILSTSVGRKVSASETYISGDDDGSSPGEPTTALPTADAGEPRAADSAGEPALLLARLFRPLPGAKRRGLGSIAGRCVVSHLRRPQRQEPAKI